MKFGEINWKLNVKFHEYEAMTGEINKSFNFP